MKTKPLILVVDDDRELVELIKFNFEQRGWNAIVSFDGMDAILKINHNKPDIVISDIIMPGVDGYSLLETVKNDPELKNIPFIFISGRKTIESKVRGLQEGADDYIVKPFVFEELFARAKAHFNVSQKIKKLESKGLRGNLDVLSIIDVLQNLSISKKTGLLSIESDEKTGDILLRLGKVVTAKISNKEGWNALYTILSINKGHFSFCEQEVYGEEFPETIERLILEFAKEFDEEQKMLKALGGINVKFKIIKRCKFKDKQDTLESIIQYIEEGKSIRQMIKIFTLSSYSIVVKLFNLFSEGYIEEAN